MNRRTFLSLSTLIPFFNLGSLLGSFSRSSTNVILNQKLRIDTKNIIDIHPSLDYKIISKEGENMSDGFKVPGLADGMGSFLINDNIILVRNHEIVPKHGMQKGAFQNPRLQIRELGDKHYDENAIGGTTNIILDKVSKDVQHQYLSLSGTHQNCAGGVTPWNTWLSCEENINKKNKNKVSHGYIFEVNPNKKGLNRPKPLKAMGRFNHEAVAFDSYNNAYLTEDRSDGLIYKFIPKTKNNLDEGELFALRIKSLKDGRNWNSSSTKVREKYSADWVKIEDFDPEDDTIRNEGMVKGATPFARPEGIISDNKSIFICCTSGGRLKKGQIWKLNPTSTNELLIELWYEVQDEASLNMPDNITIAPWGDLIICEDNSDINRLWGLTSRGKPYLIAQNSYTGSEFAGVCFSPIDNTMFVNLQWNGLTIRIDGNWNEVTK